ncbi:hypothetical protein CTEN210_02732 [Chaetoceros tenuissimus]|uniref:MORN repeat protein n=1 Tax=Chaetoceros tenuissimus TaxID=426638 RepID=A0AAD3CIH5_9STRA|nr:hypothetical protein CTEN210_02732 [Chaetoceros tenuissimus]
MPPLITETSNNSRDSSPSSSKVIYKIIYSPEQDVTYEGDVLLQKDSYVKHGRGILHNHTNGSTIQGYFQNDRIVGYALETLYDNSGRQILSQYEGSFHSSETYTRHGKGKYSWSTGDVYSGTFHMGEISGEGTFTWINGDRFEGSFKKGKMHGQGQKYFYNGDYLQGNFKKNKAHGWAKRLYKDMDSFEGMYYKGEREGYGSYHWSCGDVYVGAWLQGDIVGRGVKALLPLSKSRSSSFNSLLAIENGDDEELNQDDTSLPDVYYGDWDMDLVQDFGIKYYACGDIYAGDFLNNLKHGYGKYTWKNGDVFTGSFVNGSCNGVGMKIFSNGDVYDGNWYEDKASGYGIKYFRNGDVYSGYYLHDEKDGYGLYKWDNGDQYEGYYKDGEQSGFGEQRWRINDCIYRGKWSHNKKNGVGFLKVNINDRDLVFFELWLNGKRLHRIPTQLQWNTNVPTFLQMKNKSQCLEELLKNHWISQI